MVYLVPVSWQLYDMLSAMGIGMILAIIYDIVRLFVPSKKIFIFFCDVLIFCLAAVMIFSFAVTLSKTGVFRYPMVFATILGYCGYQILISPFTQKITKTIHLVVCLPFRVLNHYILRVLRLRFVQKVKKLAEKNKKNKQKNEKNLKSDSVMLYNSY